jgi:ABC-type Fe3+ transport system substrate-binding protein
MQKLWVWMVIGFTVFLLSLSSTAFSAQSPDQVMQELYKSARNAGESKVIWQVATTLKEMQPFIDTFEKKFPGIKVNAFSLSGSEAPARIVTEAAAKRVTMDVGEGLLENMIPLRERDLAVKLDWLISMGVSPNLLHLDNGFFGNSHDVNTVWVRNTDLVKKSDEPRTWEDLLDPKWKGNKISVRGGGFFFLGLLPEWRKNKQKVVAYLEKLKKQELLVDARAALVFDRTVRGETPIGLANLLHLPKALQDGAKIAIMPINPSVGRPNVNFIPKGSPNPNTAKLLMAWFSTKECVEMHKSLGRGLAYPPGASQMADLLQAAGVEYISMTKLEELRELDKFSLMVEEVLGFRPQ